MVTSAVCTRHMVPLSASCAAFTMRSLQGLYASAGLSGSLVHDMLLAGLLYGSGSLVDGSPCRSTTSPTCGERADKKNLC
jgi:hypothetical protein